VRSVLVSAPPAAPSSPVADLALPTALGEGRNLLIVRMADVVVAVGGSWGTLSEISLARRRNTPVVSVAGWQVTGPAADDDVVHVDGADTAVRLALELAQK
jgi:predicted Rossmann-fold nucleotide-binding protein